MSLPTFLEWDSQFFGKNIARIHAMSYTEVSITLVLDWCVQNKIDCLYVLTELDDRHAAQFVYQLKGRLVDMRFTLECDLLHGNSNLDVIQANRASIYQVRSVIESDIESLKKIAYTNHMDTRFYFDEKFDRLKCNELYAAWIERSCNGYDDIVFALINTQQQPCGYITGKRKGSRGEIGLVGVAESERGKGAATFLIRNLQLWFLQNGVYNIQVVTQGRNIIAQRLYEKCHFFSKYMQAWYHVWF